MECNRIPFPYTVLILFWCSALEKKKKRLELTIHMVFNIQLSSMSFYRLYYITYYTFMYSNLMRKELEKLTHPEMAQQQCGSTL
jgi:hypothetical protein